MQNAFSKEDWCESRPLEAWHAGPTQLVVTPDLHSQGAVQGQ